MSVVTISDTVGSLGGEIGRAVAAALGWQFADREIIEKAAERFGGGVIELTHATEERPTLLERFTDSHRRYATHVEATMFELAAHDDVVLVGRGAAFVFSQAPHTLRVRAIAPEALRVRRTEERQGMTREGAANYVRDTDRERGARMRFLYHVDLDDPLRYDLVLNTERLSVTRAARLVVEALEDERFRSTADSRRVMTDLAVTAQARAALLAGTATRSRAVFVSCVDGVVTLSGSVDAAQGRDAAEATVSAIPGVIRIVNEIVVGTAEDEDTGHGQFRHGEERSWGGYGGGWYEREWSVRQAPQPERKPHDPAA